jgi:hypothetical protein
MKLNLIISISCLLIAASCSTPAQNITVQTSQKQRSVLTNKDANEVLKIRIIKEKNKDSFENSSMRSRFNLQSR